MQYFDQHPQSLPSSIDEAGLLAADDEVLPLAAGEHVAVLEERSEPATGSTRGRPRHRLGS